MLDIKHNCNWQAGLVPVSNLYVADNINFITSELLCSSIIYLPNFATIIEKQGSGASNHSWRNVDLLVLMDITDISNGTTVQLKNNATMSAT